jgi:hypothetical protein
MKNAMVVLQGAENSTRISCGTAASTAQMMQDHAAAQGSLILALSFKRRIFPILWACNRFGRT